MYLEQRMNRIVRKGFIAIAGAIWLAVVGGVFYVAYHFVSKFW